MSHSQSNKHLLMKKIYQKSVFIFSLIFLALILISPQQLKADNYYWIGNGGNWTDLSHWATTSGGSTLHTSLPQAGDTVFFDHNSFSISDEVVLIDTSYINCHVIDWQAATNQPNFIGTSYKDSLIITGDFLLSDSVNFDFVGNLFFLNTAPSIQHIQLGNNSIKNNIYINTGTLRLLDEFIQSNGVVHHINGELSLNGNNFSCRHYNLDTATTSSITVNSPAISGSDTLYVRGHFFLNPAHSLAFTGPIYFSNNKNELYSIDFSTHLFNGDFYFGSGKYNLLSEINCNKLSFLESQSFDANANSISCNQFICNSPLTQNMDFDNCDIAVFGADDAIIINARDINPDAFQLSNFRLLYSGLDTVRIFAERDANPILVNVFYLNAAYHEFISDISADSIIVYPGRKMMLFQGTTMNFNKLIAFGDCGNYIYINASCDECTAALPIIKKNSGAENLAYCIFRNIEGQGIINAANSYDEGNTSGINISEPTATNTYYWVGNQGVWHNPMNWSTTTGGAAGSCIPSHKDNVIFDANSFSGNDTVFLFENAYCNKMKWENLSTIPSLFGENIDISINDSITFHANLNLAVDGSFTLHNESGDTSNIVSNGVSFSDTLIFNGSGYWKFEDDGQVDAPICLFSGGLDFNENSIQTHGFISNYNNTREINISNARIFLNGEGIIWNIDNTASLTYAAGGSKITTNNSNPASAIFIGGNLSYDSLFIENTSTQINNNNFFDLVSVKAGSSLILEALSTLTLDSLIANGNCAERVQILSSSLSNDTATIIKTSYDTLFVDYAMINNVVVDTSGGKEYNASNSILLNNCNGWNHTPSLAGMTYYWIGNSGEWNDTLHWSATSGGSPFGCIPGINDTVIFDENSLSMNSIVDINTKAWAYAFYTNNISDSLQINLKQDLYCAHEIFFDDSVKVIDESRDNYIHIIPKDTNALLTTESTFIEANIVFVGSSINDTLFLQDSLSLGHLYAMEIEQGSFFSNNQNIKCGTFSLINDNPKKLNLGKSTLEIMYSFEIENNTNLNYNADSSLIRIIGHPNLTTTSFYGNDENFFDLSIETFNDSLANAYFETEIYGDNQFHHLTILAGNQVLFEAGKTQTMDSLIAIGSCIDSIYLSSTSAGNIANLNKTAGDSLYIEVAVLTDINAVSGGKALFSTDNGGNNPNWTFYSNKVTNADFTWLLPSCYGDSSFFINTSDVYNGDIANLSYSWYFGDNDTSNLTNPSHLYPVDSDYDVSLVSEYINGCRDSITKTITINRAVVSLNCSDANQIICEDESVTFTAVSNKASQTYDFYLNNNLVLTDSIYTTDSLQNGDEVFVVATYNNCTKHSDTLSFIVNPRPIISLVCDDIDLEICQNDTVRFQASNADIYQFYLNGSPIGTYDTTSSLILSTINDNDTITVKGKYTASNCESYSADTLIFVVHPLPISNIVSVLPNDTICSGELVTITADGGNLYEFFINGISQGIPTMSNSFSTTAFANNDIVNVEATNVQGCKALAANPQEITVFPTPILSFSCSDPNSEICTGQNVDFLASGANEYEFFINGISVQGPSFSNSYSTTGLNNGDIVSVSGIIGNCSADADTVFSFAVYPDISLSAFPMEICEGETVIFTANGDSIYQFLVNGNPATSLSSNNIYQTDTLGIGDIVSVIGTPNACSPNPISVLVRPIPTIQVVCSDADTTICEGEMVHFTASGANQYEFFVNGISIAPISSVNIYSTDSIQDNDVITVFGRSIYGCEANSDDNFTFTVYPYPTVTMTQSDPDLTICQGDTVDFVANGADLYEFFINGISQGAPSANNLFTTSTLANLNTVTVKGTTNSCESLSDSSFTYTVYPIPNIQLSALTPITICQGDTVKLLATGGNEYEFFVDGISQGPPSGVSIFESSTVLNGQTISVVGSLNGCQKKANDSITITVHPYPNLSFSSSPSVSTICYGDSVHIQAFGASTYQFYIDSVPYGNNDTISQFNSTTLEDGQSIYIIGYIGNCSAISDTVFTYNVNKMNLSLQNNSQGNMICEGDSVEFTASGADLYEFFIDNISQGAASTQNSFTASNLSHGQIISVQGTSNTTSCVQNAYDIVWMTVYGLPVISSLDPTQFCEGDSAMLSSNYTNGNQWFWDGDSIQNAIYQQYAAHDSGLYHIDVRFGGEGLVKSIGFNGSGQLGDGSFFNSLSPIEVAAITNAVDVDCGYEFSLALSANGSVYSWGENSFGELGNGSYADNPNPQHLQSLTNVRKIAAGGNHAMAILSDSTVVSWGKNQSGQLGYGNYATSNFPFAVIGLTNVVDISAGASHSIALDSDGKVWAWGANNFGQLGNGNNTTSNIAYQVTGLSNIKKIEAGANHNLAIDSLGNLWVWGANISGQLGNSSVQSSNVPIKLNLESRMIFVDIAGGLEHSLALDTNGFVYSWGGNTHGQLAQNATQVLSPKRIDSISNIQDVEAAYYASYFIREDKTAWACGHNNHGQIGNNTQIDANFPEKIIEISAANRIAAGKYHVAIALEKGISCSSAPIQIIVDTIPDIIIYQNGTTLSTIGGGVSYQWYLNGNPIPGANTQQYIISANGNYTVEIVFANGCSGISDPFNYNVGMDEIWNENNFAIMPNPNNGNFILEINIPPFMLEEIESISCYTILGEKIMEISSNTPANRVEIQLIDAAKGIYYLNIQSSERSITKKFVVIN